MCKTSLVRREWLYYNRVDQHPRTDFKSRVFSSYGSAALYCCMLSNSTQMSYNKILIKYSLFVAIFERNSDFDNAEMTSRLKQI